MDWHFGLEKHAFFFFFFPHQTLLATLFYRLRSFVLVLALTGCKNLDTNLGDRSLSFVFFTCKMGIVVQNHIERIKLFKAQGDIQGKVDIILTLVLFSIYE